MSRYRQISLWHETNHEDGKLHEIYREQNIDVPSITRRIESVYEGPDRDNSVTTTTEERQGRKQVLEYTVEKDGVLQERRHPVEHATDTGQDNERAWITAMAREKYVYREDGTLRRVDFSEIEAKRHTIRERADIGQDITARGIRAVIGDSYQKPSSTDVAVRPQIDETAPPFGLLGKDKESVVKTRVDNRYSVLYDKEGQVECLKKTSFNSVTNSKEEFRIYLDQDGYFSRLEKKTTFYEPMDKAKADTQGGDALEDNGHDKRTVIHVSTYERAIDHDRSETYDKDDTIADTAAKIRSFISRQDLVIDHVDQKPISDGANVDDDTKKHGKPVTTVNEFGEIVKIKTSRISDFYDRVDYRVRFDETGPTAVEIYKDGKLEQVSKDPAVLESYVKDIGYYLSSSTDPVTQESARKMIAFRETNADLWGKADTDNSYYKEKTCEYDQNGRLVKDHVEDSRNGNYDVCYKTVLYVGKEGDVEEKNVPSHVEKTVASDQEIVTYKLVPNQKGEFTRLEKDTDYLDRDGNVVHHSFSISRVDRDSLQEGAAVPSLRNDGIADFIRMADNDMEKTRDDGSVDTRLIMGADGEPKEAIYFDKDGFFEDASTRKSDLDVAQYEIDKQMEANADAESRSDAAEIPEVLPDTEIENIIGNLGDLLQPETVGADTPESDLVAKDLQDSTDDDNDPVE